MTRWNTAKWDVQGWRSRSWLRGTMRFGRTADLPTAFRIMDAHVEVGGNMLDTADVYCNFSEHNAGLLAQMESLGRKLGQGTVPVVLAWLLATPLVTAPIVGANSVAQLEHSLTSVGFHLDGQAVAAMDGLGGWRVT